MSKHAIAATQPRPVLDQAKVTATIAGLVSMCASLGLFTAPVADQLTVLVKAVIAVVFVAMTTVPHIISALKQEQKVTPVASPKDDAGNELVPAGSAPATLDASVALAEANAIHPV